MTIGETVQHWGTHGWTVVHLLELCPDGIYAVVQHPVTGKRRVEVSDLKAVTQDEGR